MRHAMYVLAALLLAKAGAQAKPDLTFGTSPGWPYQVVPEASNAFPLAGPVPIPSTLTGNAGTTYVYGLLRNQGDAPSVIASAGYLLDGAAFSTGSIPAIAPATDEGTLHALLNIPGGRHTLGMALDSGGAVDESNETNNRLAAQWVWTPFQLSPDGFLSRTAPPSAGGSGDIPSGSPWPNCDGLRTPVFAETGDNGFWGGMAVMPSSGTDVDVFFDTLSSGAQSGFDSPVVRSHDGVNKVDFVIRDVDSLSGLGGRTGAWDVGVTAAAGAGAYDAHVTSSIWSPVRQGVVGPFTIGPHELLDLREFFFDKGSFPIYLQNVSGGADLGVSLFLRDDATGFYRKQNPYGGYQADSLGDGGSEILRNVSLPNGSYFLLVIWKAHPSDVLKTAQYIIRLGSAAVAVGEPGRAPALRLSAAYPNPASRSTALQFELGAAGRVDLGIFDVSGRRVATLASGTLPAGAHAARWDGRDMSGSAVPGGLYFARLQSGGRSEVKKITLVR